MPTYVYRCEECGETFERAPPTGATPEIDMIDGICAKERGGHEAFARSHLKEGGRHRLTRPPSHILG